MPESATTEVPAPGLSEHPALRAWATLQADRPRSERVEVRAVRQKVKSAVYRLAAMGPGDGAVIAKHCPLATGLIEYAVYTEVLPHMPVTSLRCYGLVREDDGRTCWLFLEEAGGEEYSPQAVGQRVLAGRWLGLLHAAASRAAGPGTRLPDRGPDRYLEHLRAARDTIVRNLTNPALTPDGLAVLRGLVAQCEALEGRWGQVQRECERMPQTLVHGDFVVKNVRVRVGPAGLDLVPLDWELAGWGLPAPDLVQSLFTSRVAAVSPDLGAYRDTVRDAWPHLDLPDLHWLAGLGRVFRLLAMTDWLSAKLAYPWVDKAVAGLGVYSGELAAALQAVGWAGVLRPMAEEMTEHMAGAEAMAAATDKEMPPVEAAALRAWLQRQAPDFLGRPAAVTGLERARSAYASSYEAEVLTVQVAGGEGLKVFFKNLGVTQFPKDGARQRRDRERAVYRDLLAGADLGPPRCFGSVWDESVGRHWLFLEFVEGVLLRSCELRYWADAARWLGRLQGYFAPRAGRLSACDFLVRHDAAFFRAKAAQALRDVGQIFGPLADRLAGALDDYEQILGVFLDQPRTLVHGNYRPSNVLVVPGPGPVRVCPVDWEQAGWGSALYDLAYLTDGFEGPELDLLLEAYRGEAAGQGVAVPDPDELRQLVAGFRLFVVVNLLSRACERGFSEQKVAKTVALAEELHRCGLTGRAGGGSA
jgi:aminoglycoside phosphotransferase (APT) family kinase protein